MTTNKQKATPAPGAAATGAAPPPPADAENKKGPNPNSPPAEEGAKEPNSPPAEETAKEATPPPAEEAAKVADSSKKEFHNYQARKYAIRHPYQEVKIPVSGSVTLFKDSWIDAQVGANVITDLGPAE